VRAERAGTVSAVHVSAGDGVSAGDVMAVIE
jgi:biotin carboxyl carrier protein